MRTLLQRASYLFWQYPVLWVPMLAAAMVTYFLIEGLKQCSRAGTHVLLASQSYSVLDGDRPFAISKGLVIVLLILGALMVFGLMVAISGYVVGVLARAISGGQISEPGREIGKLTWDAPQGWGTYSIWLMLILAGTALVGIVIHERLKRWGWMPIIMPWHVNILIYAVAAELLKVRPMMTLVKHNLIPDMNSKVRLQHPRRRAYALMGSYAGGYFFLVQLMEIVSRRAFHIPMLDREWIRLPVGMTVSMIEAIPGIFVAIAFILIAQQEAQESRDIPQGDESPVDGLAGSL